MKKAKLLFFALLIIFSLTSVAYADSYKDGSTGKAVESIQQQLKKLGFFQGEVTGYFGPQTETAVKRFQLKRGLHADGIVGATTYKYLFESTSKTSTTEHVMTIKEIQTALKKLGYYAGSVDGISGSKTEAAIKKFQSANKLQADGIVGTATKAKISAAVSKAATNTAKATATKTTTTKATSTTTQATTVKTTAKSEHDVELLDWFKEVNNIFKIGSTATITDIKTGKTFEVVRTYGHNHADVEAKTAEDSKIMKGIWGSWNWNRRPVVVEVNGHKIAGSMTAMPHAGVDNAPANQVVSSRSGGYSRGTNFDKVKDNGMNGHVDIHFLNSKNHYNNKVDLKHQAVVKEAAKY